MTTTSAPDLLIGEAANLAGLSVDTLRRFAELLRDGDATAPGPWPRGGPGMTAAAPTPAGPSEATGWRCPP